MDGPTLVARQNLRPLTRPLNKTVAWNIMVKWPSTDQAGQGEFNKLAQHLLVAEALTADYKKTIQRNMLQKKMVLLMALQ